MRDIRTGSSGGTAPLSADLAPPPAQRQDVKPGDTQSTLQADASEVRTVASKAQTGKLSFGDPVADAYDKGAENLASAVLETGDTGLIDKVKARLGDVSSDELRDIARGKPLSEKQKKSLDANEKGLLLEAVTDTGCKAAMEQLKSRSDSG
ncbi:MAG: hypothetical protein H7338_21700 [Candidatus Sericytochromatia bacterium]|nr:hypothetical protein [Candidatus Sericytochromatia bacterium]